MPALNAFAAAFAFWRNLHTNKMLRKYYLNEMIIIYVCNLLYSYLSHRLTDCFMGTRWCHTLRMRNIRPDLCNSNAFASRVAKKGCEGNGGYGKYIRVCCTKYIIWIRHHSCISTWRRHPLMLGRDEHRTWLALTLQLVLHKIKCIRKIFCLFRLVVVVVVAVAANAYVAQLLLVIRRTLSTALCPSATDLFKVLCRQLGLNWRISMGKWNIDPFWGLSGYAKMSYNLVIPGWGVSRGP